MLGYRSKRGWLAFGLTVLLVAAAACSRSPRIPGGPDDADSLVAPKALGSGVCNLLGPDEVELALNVGLDGSTARPLGRPILAGMEMCSLNSGDPSRQPEASAASWGLLSSSARRYFDRYRSVNGALVEELEIAGCPALWDRRLRTMIVLVGEKAVGVRLKVSRPALRKDETPGEYLQRNARLLTARAIARL